MDFALDPAAVLASLLIPAQILFVNLLLSADNALVIALACRGLRPQDVQRATLLGILGAILLRLVMGSAAVFLLRAPLVQLAAGVLLLGIAVRLTLIDADGLATPADEPSPAQARALVGAVWTIVVADVTMSLDIRELLDRNGWLVLVSGAFLGWVAGGVALADPLVAPSVAANAPALPYALPAACALFVIWQNFILDPRRARLRHAD
jgi:predicted tellurium resistance membrane protein TerC